MVTNNTNIKEESQGLKPFSLESQNLKDTHIKRVWEDGVKQGFVKVSFKEFKKI